jgi:hypothetical protein
MMFWLAKFKLIRLGRKAAQEWAPQSGGPKKASTFIGES